jgi:hypothetical protein
MDLRLGETPGWCQVAIVEVPDNTAGFPELIRDDALQFQVRLADKSPTGYLWYEIYVDPSFGDRRVARTAWAVLTALKKSSDAGFLEGLRIINGEQWLTLGDNSEAQASANATSLGNLAPQ